MNYTIIAGRLTSFNPLRIWVANSGAPHDRIAGSSVVLSRVYDF